LQYASSSIKWPSLDYLLRNEHFGRIRSTIIQNRSGDTWENAPWTDFSFNEEKIAGILNRGGYTEKVAKKIETSKYTLNTQYVKHLEKHKTNDDRKNLDFGIEADSHGHEVFDQTLENMADNFIQANFFFANKQAELITESPKYPTAFDFFQDLGGAMSLWLGITLVGAFEVIEWLIRMCLAAFYCQCCKRIKHRYIPTSQSDDPHNIPVSNNPMLIRFSEL